MNNMEELRAAADSDTNRFHIKFDSNVRELMEPVRIELLESVESCTEEEIIGQLLMNYLEEVGDDQGPCFAGNFNLRQKQRLMAIANHLGPDWAQALYHAAVFITKVA